MISKIIKNVKKLTLPIPICGFCVFLIITVIAILLFGKIQNNVTSSIASTVIGLLSGALASIITAIIFEHSKCKRIERLVEEDLKYLKMWIDELFQEISSFLPAEDLQECMNFKSVFPKFVEQMESTKKNNALDKKYLGIYVNIQLIISTIDKLTTGEEKAYIFTKYGDASYFIQVDF